MKVPPNVWWFGPYRVDAEWDGTLVVRPAYPSGVPDMGSAWVLARTIENMLNGVDDGPQSRQDGRERAPEEGSNVGDHP